MTTPANLRIARVREAARAGDLARVNELMAGLPYAAKAGAAGLIAAMEAGQWAVATALAGSVNVTCYRHRAVEQAILLDRADLFARMRPRVSGFADISKPWAAAFRQANPVYFEGLLTALTTAWKPTHAPWVQGLLRESLSAGCDERTRALLLAIPFELHTPDTVDRLTPWLARQPPEALIAVMAHAGPLAGRYPEALALARQGALAQQPAPARPSGRRRA